jgi:hypothetical protein
MKKARNLLLSCVVVLGLLTTACQEQTAETQQITAETTVTTTAAITTITATETEASTAATTPLPAAVVNGAAQLTETAVSFSNGITVRLALPDGFYVAEPAEKSEIYLPVTGHENTPGGYCHIIKDGKTVGAISTAGMDLKDFQEGQKEAFLAGDSPTAMYNSFMLGSLYTWNVDYTNVTPVGEDSGAATCLVYYRSDMFLNDTNITLPHAKSEKAYDSDFDDRMNYYNRGILAYNFDLETYIGVELDYDCVNDATQTAIAKTVQITDDGEGLSVTATATEPFDSGDLSRVYLTQIGDPADPEGEASGWLKIMLPDHFILEKKSEAHESFLPLIAAEEGRFPLTGMPVTDEFGGIGNYAVYSYIIDCTDETNPHIVGAMSYKTYDTSITDPNEIYRDISQGTDYLFDIGVRYEVLKTGAACVTALTDVIYTDGTLNYGVVSHSERYARFAAVELSSDYLTQAQARTIAESIDFVDG